MVPSNKWARFWALRLAPWRAPNLAVAVAQLAATAVGTLLGALAGSEIGKSLDRADMTYLQQTQQKALETIPSGSSSNLDEPGFGKLGSGYSATHIPECGRHLLP